MQQHSVETITRLLPLVPFSTTTECSTRLYIDAILIILAAGDLAQGLEMSSVEETWESLSGRRGPLDDMFYNNNIQDDGIFVCVAETALDAVVGLTEERADSKTYQILQQQDVEWLLSHSTLTRSNAWKLRWS